MTTYKELYFHLFNTLTDAICELEERQVVTDILRMKRAQLATDEIHLETDIIPEDEVAF